jgi:hypothetical protein
VCEWGGQQAVVRTAPQVMALTQVVCGVVGVSWQVAAEVEMRHSVDRRWLLCG